MLPLAIWLLAKAIAKLVSMSHHFAGRAHFRTENRVNLGKAREREHGFLHRDMRDDRFLQRKLFQLFSGHYLRGEGGHGQADGFGHERHGAAGARVHFENVDVAVLDGELHVHQPHNPQRQREFYRLLA